MGKFCPAWQGRGSELLTDKELQKAVLMNPHYSKITPAVEIMKTSIKHLKSINNDGYGIVVGADVLKAATDTHVAGSTTVGVTFALLHFVQR